VFVLAKQRPDAVPLLVQTAHSWLCRKANDDAHEYKFLHNQKRVAKIHQEDIVLS
jgi:hypothetical protein